MSSAESSSTSPKTSRRQFLYLSLTAGAKIVLLPPLAAQARVPFAFFKTSGPSTAVLRVSQVYGAALTTTMATLPAAILRASQVYGSALTTTMTALPAPILRVSQVYGSALTTTMTTLPDPILRVSHVYAMVLVTAP